MTDRISSFTVVLTEDVRDDDLSVMMEALKQFRFVAAVTPNPVVSASDYAARARVDLEWRGKILSLLRDS